MNSIHPNNAKITDFIEAVIRGGPHDGQSIRVPDDQDQVTFYEAGTPHQYYRLGKSATFYHPSHPMIRGISTGGRR